ncbi:MAG TPA: SDR family NAD(P)-dependent oxidoreductase [Caulobacteraceae bacterium]|nr:SDR family NAD(P)-dependent oxidoreductase [Caulobacteraceae bacterium]
MRVIVSGGCGTLGRAVARQLLERGDAVAVVDRAEHAPADLGGCALIGGVDLTDPGEARAAADKAAAALGGLEAVVNIAGGFIFETLAGGSAETLKAMFAMNALTAYNLTAASAERLPRGGRIVNIGAGAVGGGGAGMGPYAASKAAVIELTRCHATELASRGITVNAVLPSIIDTPANRAAMPKADRSSWVAPEAIAEVIAFLLSPASGAITGALIPVANPG